MDNLFKFVNPNVKSILGVLMKNVVTSHSVITPENFHMLNEEILIILEEKFHIIPKMKELAGRGYLNLLKRNVDLSSNIDETVSIEIVQSAIKNNQLHVLKWLKIIYGGVMRRWMEKINNLEILKWAINEFNLNSDFNFLEKCSNVMFVNAIKNDFPMAQWIYDHYDILHVKDKDKNYLSHAMGQDVIIKGSLYYSGIVENMKEQAFMNAIKTGNLNIVKWVIEKLEINISWYKYDSAISAIIYNSHSNIIKWIRKNYPFFFC